MPLNLPFPTTPVLDDFNRADENPLSTTGPWGAPIFTGGLQTMKLSSNAIMDDSLADGGSSGQAYRDDQNYGPNAEVFVTIFNPWVNNSSDFWVWLNGSNEATASLSGYQLYVVSTGGTWFWAAYRYDNLVGTQIHSFVAGPALASGDSIGMRHIGGWLQFFYKPSGGAWQKATNMSDVQDNTYTSGHIGVSKGFQDVTSSLDDFGGGTYLPSPLFRGS